jgi:hypothetical protein
VENEHLEDQDRGNDIKKDTIDVIARRFVRVSTVGRSERFGHGGLEYSDSVVTVLATSLLYQDNSTATSDCRTDPSTENC